MEDSEAVIQWRIDQALLCNLFSLGNVLRGRRSHMAKSGHVVLKNISPNHRLYFRPIDVFDARIIHEALAPDISLWLLCPHNEVIMLQYNSYERRNWRELLTET